MTTVDVRAGAALDELVERAGAGGVRKRLPPKAEMRKPATTAVTNPLSGVAPEAMASAMASGRATIATVSPSTAS